MNKFLYYPGCSLEGTAKAYDIATRAFFQAMDFELTELTDWTCCGATAADTVSPLLALSLSARNLALSEKHMPRLDLLVPCSACYHNLKRTAENVKRSPATLADINYTLESEGLSLQGNINVRHLLDVFKNHVGLKELKRKISRPFNDLVVAPYYGCQCLRPYAVFDDPEAPESMEPFVEVTGARIHPWSMGAKCCGASHMNTHTEVGLELSGAILAAARGADVIVTVCPMCQLNLEAYQGKISRIQDKDLSISILYLPQLLGLAIGLNRHEVGLGLNMVVKGNMKAAVDATSSGN